MPLIAGGHGESELPDLLHERRENLVGSFGKQLSNSSRELAERIFGEQMAAEIPRCHLLWDKAADQAFDEELCLPLGAVWDEYCQRKSVPVGPAWMQEVKGYEKSVLLAR